jgi:hypothetical protein
MTTLGRRRSRWVALLGSFLLLGAAMGGIAAASPANAATTVTISLTNASGECIDVWNNDHVAGEQLNLWTCPGPSGTWIYKTPYKCIENTMSDCFEFEDPHNTSLCIGAPVGSDGLLTLQTCGSDDSRTTWYIVDGSIYSGAYGSSHTIASDGGSNKDLLYAMIKPPPSGYWWNWHIS